MLKTEIKKHINKLIHPLKEEEELIVSLKLKLTKKEFKLLNAWAFDTSIAELKTKLNLDDERYDSLSKQLVKKLNQEKIKQALSI